MNKQTLIGFRKRRCPYPDCNAWIYLLAVNNARYYPQCTECGRTSQIDIGQPNE